MSFIPRNCIILCKTTVGVAFDQIWRYMEMSRIEVANKTSTQILSVQLKCDSKLQESFILERALQFIHLIPVSCKNFMFQVTFNLDQKLPLKFYNHFA